MAAPDARWIARLGARPQDIVAGAHAIRHRRDCARIAPFVGAREVSWARPHTSPPADYLIAPPDPMPPSDLVAPPGHQLADDQLVHTPRAAAAQVRQAADVAQEGDPREPQGGALARREVVAPHLPDVCLAPQLCRGVAAHSAPHAVGALSGPREWCLAALWRPATPTLASLIGEDWRDAWPQVGQGARHRPSRR